MSHVSLKEACNYLDVEDCTIINSAKYNAFYKRSDKGTKNASFNLSGYLKYRDTMDSLTEKVKLLIEYLHHEEKVSYQSLSNLTGVHVQAIALHTFAYKKALIIAVYVREFMPFHFKRFDEYYDWKQSTKEPTIKYTVNGWKSKNIKV